MSAYLGHPIVAGIYNLLNVIGKSLVCRELPRFRRCEISSSTRFSGCFRPDHRYKDYIGQFLQGFNGKVSSIGIIYITWLAV